MDFLIAVLWFAAAMAASLAFRVSMVYALLAGLLGFAVVALCRGYRPKEIARMMGAGVKTSLLIIQVFLLIGLLTAAWRASGTISISVYYGTALLHPRFFLPAAFLLCCLFSMLLGTAFGTAGTIGLVLVVLAKSAGLNVAMTAGAVVAGSYFGDRASPLSSSANLVAMLTGTDLYTNIRNMLKTAALPFSLSLAGYFFLSFGWEGAVDAGPIRALFREHFSLGFFSILPALVLLVFIFFRASVKRAMAASIVCAWLVALFAEGAPIGELAHDALFGYTLRAGGELAELLAGGGISSMARVTLIIVIASAFSGIFDGTDMLKEVKALSSTLADRLNVYAATLLTSVATSVFACNQTLSVMLLYQFERDIYREKGLSNYRLALDLADTAILTAVLVPWGVAVGTPMAMFGVGPEILPFLLYIILAPLCGLFGKRRVKTPKISENNPDLSAK